MKTVSCFHEFYTLRKWKVKGSWSYFLSMRGMNLNRKEIGLLKLWLKLKSLSRGKSLEISGILLGTSRGKLVERSGRCQSNYLQENIICWYCDVLLTRIFFSRAFQAVFSLTLDSKFHKRCSFEIFVLWSLFLMTSSWPIKRTVGLPAPNQRGGIELIET